MIARILGEALRRRTRRAVAAVAAITVGAALAGSLVAISLNLTEKMAREMRSYGANIVVSPSSGAQVDVGGVTIRPPAARGAIAEADLAKLKTIFWRNNIAGFAPFLSAWVDAGGRRIALTGTWFDRTVALPAGAAVRTTYEGTTARASGESFRAGVRAIAPWWKVRGEWASDEDPASAVVGSSLAGRLGVGPGDPLAVAYGGRPLALRVSGVVSTGGYEEEQVFVPLSSVQRLVGARGGADKVLVSALVLPDSKLRADLRGTDPSRMSPEQYATWYCSPVMGAVLTQIREVLPGTDVNPVRQIAQAEGAFLGKVGLLVSLLTVAALAGSALAVATVMTASVVERRAEIGLMKAVGADRWQIAAIFLAEAGVFGLAGGLLGYAGAAGVTSFVGARVFSSPAPPPLFVLPVTLALALGVALAGSALPVRRAMRLDPVVLLRGG